MKAKLVLLLLFMLSSSLSVFATHYERKARFRQKDRRERVISRAPFDPTIQVDEANGILLLTFQYSLEDANITITDKNGNEVMHERKRLRDSISVLS